jgi:hypothetical protein
LHHRPDDEHMTVPVWRMRQLQNVEQAAREVVEVCRTASFSPAGEPGRFAAEIRGLLEDALGDD